jgi:hypothetical protein
MMMAVARESFMFRGDMDDRRMDEKEEGWIVRREV